MTTPRDDIAATINGLNVYAKHAMPCYPNDICSIAATQLAALQARVKELEGQLAAADATLLRLNSGKELQDLMRLNNELESRALRADQELDAMNDNHRVMARQMADLGRALIKAEQDRDEAIAALKPFVDVAEEMLSRGWDASNVALALDNPNEPHRVTAGDFFAIRQLSAGNEKEKKE